MNIKEVVDKLNKQFEQLQRIPVSQKLFFVQQLGIMIKTGISLAKALKALEEQTTSKRFKAIMHDVYKKVEKGNTLSDALTPYSKIFGELFINMIKAGEISGKLEEVLEQLYIQMKKDHEIISRVRGAMIYPAIVVTMMVAIGILMIIYVIPTLISIFEEVSVQLPLPTRVLIWLSKFVNNNGIALVVLLVILIVSFVSFIRWPKGRKKWHQLLLHLPIVKEILKKINLARFSRTFSSLLKTDIPIVKSFDITAHVLGNVLYRQALLESMSKVETGVAVNQSLSNYPSLFPPVMIQMITVGEETGTLDDILTEAATFYEDDVTRTMENLPSIIEPVLIVILGIGVAMMALAVIGPLYSLAEVF
ncbi:MAG: hypothetical protein COT81_00360 [Candidatus Buchananbacteria bacterium CG10_big_fil_rev_8_21_14_0_10_42_9]|uniref:Type II secretion system protein GspF domain-containing protein n=1 Tax=Candidatus Buchananbacteria bacterium CG10_big_fil_rev_8_21_14_0_10_42_9 TaxID=1974526 RepID=A0A2H0W4T6_9BACT|nr:MAG: hypothetical protein COT81_00360 [Candidatus Buchananbacteria bacterium CG10_big_fil_rev_8_21_14_0_10_42_9]